MTNPEHRRIPMHGMRAGIVLLGVCALLLFILGPRGLGRLRLALFIARLPESVVLIRHIPTHDSIDGLWTIGERLFPSLSIPAAWYQETPSLVLYVRTGTSLTPLRILLSPSETAWSHTTLTGDPETLTMIRGSMWRMPSFHDIRFVQRLLRGGQSFLLFRPSFLVAQHPLFGDLGGTGWDALTWTSDRQEVRFRVLHFAGASFLQGTQLQLPLFVLPPPLALDGFRFEHILPVNLPPTLQILREATGVREELRRVQEVFAKRPTAFLLLEENQHLRPILVMTVDPGDRTSVRERITELFRAQLRLLHAESERVRIPDGRTVRHRRAPAEVPLEEHEDPEGVIFLRAPCAIARELSSRLQEICRGNDPRGPETEERPDDLVALVGRERVVVGTSEASVRAVFQTIEKTSLRSSLGRGTVAATIDLERLRHLPFLAGVLGDKSPSEPPWWTTLRRFSVTIERTVGGIVANGSLSLAPFSEVSLQK